MPILADSGEGLFSPRMQRFQTMKKGSCAFLHKSPSELPSPRGLTRLTPQRCENRFPSAFCCDAGQVAVAAPSSAGRCGRGSSVDAGVEP